MADTRKTNRMAKGSPENFDFKFCCGDDEMMTRMMRRFCDGKNGTFDCSEMMQKMQKMCCAPSEKSDQ